MIRGNQRRKLSRGLVAYGVIGIVVAALGAFVPVLFGKETVGQLETVSERVPGLEGSRAAC